MSYGPGHPWYYYHKGDGQPPLPVEEIVGGDWVSMHHGKVVAPKNVSAEIIRVQQALDGEIAHYHTLIAKGTKAMDNYSVNICHGGDAEMAWAESVSLVHNHIYYDRTQLKWLQSLLSKPAPRKANLSRRPIPNLLSAL